VSGVLAATEKEIKNIFTMAKQPTYRIQTRVIKVMHPTIPNVILFEAVVNIRNLNTSLVKIIKQINIEYELKEKN
jgi:hypothetical protein